MKRYAFRNAMTMVAMGAHNSVTIFEATDHAGGNGFLTDTDMDLAVNLLRHRPLDAGFLKSPHGNHRTIPS